MMVSFTNFTICETEVQNERKHTTTLAFTSLPLHDRSDRFSQPIRPVTYPEASTGQTGPTDRSDRSTQNRGAAHSTLQCATQQLPSLGVSLHHLPPLYIPADEFDTAGAEVNVWMA